MLKEKAQSGLESRAFSGQETLIEIDLPLSCRYHPSADAKHVENQKGEEHELKENLEKYPSKLTPPSIFEPPVIFNITKKGVK